MSGQQGKSENRRSAQLEIVSHKPWQTGSHYAYQIDHAEESYSLRLRLHPEPFPKAPGSVGATTAYAILLSGLTG
ncbi:predicted protein [Verticillium alfalfae VaMs.102]|uniref:Predicted protein n=1 Tax=Verticillium alfalfae (strain VaMs.102 / ATCC MYA-4576 / FGSC 10136) TaxID=526221 RepID=C9SD94_VERA1|nr:predicted protein [Verticillium alfalfae VaMs.102]EEY17059.1 predicted protein [Verticillium alfalfae VaMs.102]